MNIVKEFRANFSLTQEQAATIFGLTRRHVINLENSDSAITRPLFMACFLMIKLSHKKLSELNLEITKQYNEYRKSLG